MARVDVTVMGAGIFGLSIAYACLQRGASVRVLDRVAIGAGASGGLVGALSPHTPENWNEKKEFQFESLLMAAAFWRQVDALSGASSGYARCGRLQAIPTERALALAHRRTETAAELWRGKAQWKVIAQDPSQTWSPAARTGWLIHDTLSARMHPRHACDSLAGAIRALGGEIGCGDTPDRGGGLIVWATGAAGLDQLSRALGRPIGNGVKGQALLLAADPGDVPQLYSDGIHIVPHHDGTVAIGSTSEREFDAPDTTDGQLDDLHARALAAFPVLVGAPVVARWAGVRPRAVSRAPILGRWPTRSNHFIANGGFKIGFGMAPKVGETMADLILDGTDRIPTLFRVSSISWPR